MDNGLATNAFENSLIVQAHEFFQLQVREWISSDPNSVQRRAEALQTAVAGMLQIVVIDLKSEDDPHVIFETMNARGTPLLQSDLIKNYVVSRVGTSQDDIWGELDGGWWRGEIGRGRQRRPRIDVLLNYWLAMRTRDEVAAGRVFNTFRSLSDGSDGLPIDKVVVDVKRDLGNYRRFETEPQTPDEGMFRYRTDVMQMIAITPILLLLLSAPREKQTKSLKALESFLIRRMVCRASTRGYGRLAIDLAGELQESELDYSDRVVVEFLKNEIADYRVWPDDAALEHSLSTLPLYRMLTRGRLRLILEGVEEVLRRSSMAEETTVPKNLTIEHVMPQSWEANWPLPDGVERLEATNSRSRLVHTIGNLTLVTNHLNPTLSNDAWENKRNTLRKHSVMLLNDRLLAESEGKEWDEAFIQARSKRMAALVAEAWPGPHSPVWDQ